MKTVIGISANDHGLTATLSSGLLFPTVWLQKIARGSKKKLRNILALTNRTRNRVARSPFAASSCRVVCKAARIECFCVLRVGGREFRMLWWPNLEEFSYYLVTFCDEGKSVSLQKFRDRDYLKRFYTSLEKK